MKLRNPGPIEFDAPVCRGDTKYPAARWVEFPHSVEELYGTRGRVPVKVTFNGIPYVGSMVKMGTECHMILILKEIQKQLGSPDTVRVRVELDDSPRVITLDDDARRALEMSEAASASWDKLSYSHQREYHLWITDAKRSETRQRRIAQMIERLQNGKPLR